MRTTIRIGILTAAVLVVTISAVAGASSTALQELLVSDLFTGPGHMKKLGARVT